MDLKKYLKIFRENIFLFVIIILVFMGIGVGYRFYKASLPTVYDVSLLINVTRGGIQETQDYRFDEFYRLQADEKFADTVVRWLSSPRIVTDIYNETGIVSGDVSIKKLSKTFKAKRMSSQMIDVRFTAGNVRMAQDISESLVKSINQESKNLNQFQKEDNWFKIVGEEPVIKEQKTIFKEILIFFTALGVFFAIWIVLIKNYLTRE
jgi:capsular polysaccharide biosynthesis protein